MSISCNPYSLEGKTVLVTGASSGIGKATAIECAKVGADVIITGRNKERLEQSADSIAETTGSYPKLLSGDLNVEYFREDLCDSMKGMTLDGVALCAGTVSVLPVSFATSDKIMKVFETNFFANVDLIRRLLKGKNLKRGSSVAVITSVLGIDGFMNGNASYGASKSALESWVKYCALEYSSKGIRFNTIHPGSIDTPMISLSSIADEQMEKELTKIPIKRMGKPEEIARPIVFLLSEASSFITGSSIVADGGQHLLF